MSVQYKSPMKVMLSNVRINYANIWEPRSYEGADPKYSLSAIIPKDNGELVEKVRKAIDAAIEDGKARKWGGVIPEDLMLPLHDGDEEKPEDEAYVNSFFLNANSDEAPHIVDRHVKPINDPKEVYSGCYCNVTISFFPFKVRDNKGVAVSLGNIQVIRKGPRIIGKAPAEKDFEPINDDDDFVEVSDDEVPDFF